MDYKIVIDGERAQFVADVIVEYAQKYGIDSLRAKKDSVQKKEPVNEFNDQ
ncbi:hypothetical protein [Bacillus thuringiensis]|uniref:hypothetical protein n=1 Tax=Bacillus thuringiensis TaxID=1428 RepID=UPI0033356D3D